jgi:hypothetical protein
MAKQTKTTHFEINVIRGGRSIRYNAERYPNRSAALNKAKSLGEYCEVHKVETITTNTFVDRVEA